MLKKNQPVFLIGLTTLWLLIAIINTPAWGANQLTQARIWQAPDHTRLVFETDKPVQAKLFSLTKPDRLVIDLTNIQQHTTFNKLQLKGSPITKVRSAVRQGNNLRIVLDLKSPVTADKFTLGPNQQYGHRLVVDLHLKQARQAVVNREKQKPVTNQPTLTLPKGKRDVVIVLDPGHGGEDPGATYHGLKEKHIALAIAKRLARLINRQPGMKAVLTRTSDYYIPLRKRTTIARKAKADLFVSIHADAYKKSSARGASVFTLSSRGASSETARWLAQRENNADLIGGASTIDLNDTDKTLRSVLLDLSITAQQSTSLKAGQQVLSAMDKIAKLHKPRVEQAGFVVLKSPDIPSMLVEAGFLSNPGEAKKLASPAYQQKLAQAIFNGIKAYFQQQPPPGTYLAQSQQGQKTTHVVARGETLSEIAQRYSTSVAQLRQANGLKNSVIYVGRTLTIPVS
jgi:N-acetylmuramoyl-L-alanine amidase